MDRPGVKRKKSMVREYVEALATAAVFTLAMRQFVIQAFRIPSESMQNTLLVGDYLFVSKFEYGPRLPFTHIRVPGLRTPRHGDVIVFDWPPDPRRQFIKRCIATGGERIEIRHKDAYRNGRRLVEPYVRHVQPAEDPAGVSPRDNLAPQVVPANALFMMGDNRDNSLDSRYWGPVPLPLVQGRALFTYFSTAGNHWWDAFFHIRFNRMFRPIH